MILQIIIYQTSVIHRLLTKIFKHVGTSLDDAECCDVSKTASIRDVSNYVQTQFSKTSIATKLEKNISILIYSPLFECVNFTICSACWKNQRCHYFYRPCSLLNQQRCLLLLIPRDWHMPSTMLAACVFLLTRRLIQDSILSCSHDRLKLPTLPVLLDLSLVLCISLEDYRKDEHPTQG